MKGNMKLLSRNDRNGNHDRVFKRQIKMWVLVDRNECPDSLPQSHLDMP